MKKTLQIASSPHLASGASVERIMRHVIIALLPACLFAVYIFGLDALLTLSAATGACLLTEHGLCRAGGEQTPVSDGSVAVTGLIYGLTLPPSLPLWMTVLGAVFAVAVGKFIFGGLGANVFNPALVGRAFLQAAFPGAMTTWAPALGDERFTSLSAPLLTMPFAAPEYDAITAATPLAAWKFNGQLTAVTDLALGMTTGSTGETCAVLILLGGLYLAALRIVQWRIPVAIFVVTAAAALLFNAIDADRYPGPLFTLASGGLMLGAVFMATDMVASPLTRLGCWLYGALIGALIIAIRFWGGLAEGVMYALLIANAASPHIDRWLQPVAYGSRGSAA
jgi:electron transport complex protein RnfD